MTTTSASQLLADLRARGLTIYAEGDRLLWRGPSGLMRPEDSASMKLAKPALLELLAAEVDARAHEFWRLVAGSSVPFLGLDVPAVPGACLSCGKANSELAGGVRCMTCAQAAQLVVDRALALRNGGAR